MSDGKVAADALAESVALYHAKNALWNAPARSADVQHLHSRHRRAMDRWCEAMRRLTGEEPHQMMLDKRAVNLD